MFSYGVFLESIHVAGNGRKQDWEVGDVML